MRNCDADVIRRVEKLCRMNAALDAEMTKDERILILHLHMLEASGTVRDHHLLTHLVDQVVERVTGRLVGKNRDFG